MIILVNWVTNFRPPKLKKKKQFWPHVSKSWVIYPGCTCFVRYQQPWSCRCKAQPETVGAHNTGVHPNEKKNCEFLLLIKCMRAERQVFFSGNWGTPGSAQCRLVTQVFCIGRKFKAFGEGGLVFTVLSVCCRCTKAWIVSIAFREREDN